MKRKQQSKFKLEVNNPDKKWLGWFPGMGVGGNVVP